MRERFITKNDIHRWLERLKVNNPTLSFENINEEELLQKASEECNFSVQASIRTIEKEVQHVRNYFYYGPAVAVASFWFVAGYSTAGIGFIVGAIVLALGLFVSYLVNNSTRNTRINAIIDDILDTNFIPDSIFLNDNPSPSADPLSNPFNTFQHQVTITTSPAKPSPDSNLNEQNQVAGKKINIAGIDKAELLVALYNNSRNYRMILNKGRNKISEKPEFTLEEAQSLINDPSNFSKDKRITMASQNNYILTINGLAIYLNLSDNTCDAEIYDKLSHWEGNDWEGATKSAAQIVNEFRAEKFRKTSLADNSIRFGFGRSQLAIGAKTIQIVNSNSSQSSS